MDWQDVKFSECAVHTMIRYAGDKCPVCAGEEQRTKLLGKIYALESQIASLEMTRATATAE